MNENIVVLTYNHPHRKTEDLCVRLKLKGYDNVILASVPWQDKPQRAALWSHRPMKAHVSPIELARALGYQLSPHKDYHSVLQFMNHEIPRFTLVGGAGILPENFVTRWKIINTHPGYLPYVRGLDALKWAIYRDLPIGITTHFCGIKADTGLVIRQEPLDLKYGDTLHSVAQRMYDLEIDMLSSSINDWISVNTKDLVEFGEYYRCRDTGVDVPSVVNKRMAMEKEVMLGDLLQARIMRDVQRRL